MLFRSTWDWSQRTILAIDTISCPQDQLGDVTMSRELCKAWTGFRSVSGRAISTGHWGCGAFGGDPNIKCLVQVIAACLAVNRLDFYCFNAFYNRLSQALLKLKGQTVEWLWEKLVLFRSGQHGDRQNILDFIAKAS